MGMRPKMIMDADVDQYANLFNSIDRIELKLATLTQVLDVFREIRRGKLANMNPSLTQSTPPILVGGYSTRPSTLKRADGNTVIYFCSYKFL